MPPEGARRGRILLLEETAEADVRTPAAAAYVADALERPLFRLELRSLHRPDDVAPSIAALLSAAGNVGAVTLLEQMDVLVPVGSRQQPVGHDPWAVQLTALAIREAVRAHPLPVIVAATSAGALHPLLAREIDLSVSLGGEPIDDG